MALIILLLGVMITPLAALAQPPRVPTVGVLSPGPSTAPAASMGREALERGLKELGWVPGQTIRIDYRYADGQQEKLDQLAQDLVRAGRDVIVARATPSIRAMKPTSARPSSTSTSTP